MKKMFAILVCVSLIGILTACNNISLNTSKNQPQLEVREQDSIKNFYNIFLTKKSTEDDDFCVVSDNKFRPMISNDKKYIYDIAYDMHDKDYFYRGFLGTRTELREWRIRVYDINNLNILYDIDLKSLLEPYLKDNQFIGNTLQGGIKDGKQVIIFELQKRQTDEELISKIDAEYVMFWLDFEAGEVHLLKPEDNVEIISYTYDSENLWMLLGTDILPDGFFANNCSWIENSSYIRVPTNKLPEHNEKLYGKFPELKGVKKEDGVYAYLFQIPKADNMEALSLILDDYEDFDFSTISADSDGFYGMYEAQNGEGHNISEEEYKQFQDEYWKYRKEQREKYGIEINNK